MQGTQEEERIGGREGYLDVLAHLHNRLAPTSYLEIGVRHGRTLSLARCRATGVDPAPEIRLALPNTAAVVCASSDEFFQSLAPSEHFDLTLIDGLHLFEQVLKDFINAERVARPGSALLIDDIFPNHAAQAERNRRTKVWTGDVWKIVDVLKAYRPDLFIAALDTRPTGMLLVAGLDPENRALDTAYQSLIDAHAADVNPPRELTHRVGSLDPGSVEFKGLVDALADCYQERTNAAATVDRLRARNVPAVSVIVISYNMARELPRTIKSLSPAMQRGVGATDYEIILIDNGSTQPFDNAALSKLAPNLTIHRMENAAASPVAAINFGLTKARGELIGVCIDGARMASPGLVASALAASKVHSRPVIGSIAFHLGPEVQMRSILKGYNQNVEDDLLATSGWEEDGYRLFDVAVFAGSSDAGWFTTPAESNALFLRASHWRELGGFDPRFESPGGGLANLDTWARACEDPTGELILLLGEATFHQVHGGIATNNPSPPREMFRAEYLKIRGKPYTRPTRRPRFYGGFNSHSARSIQISRSPV